MKPSFFLLLTCVTLASVTALGQTFAPANPMLQPRSGHASLLVGNYTQVLVVGGAGNTAEIYDDLTGLWAYTNSPMTVARQFGVIANQFSDTQGNQYVLVAGGEDSNGYPIVPDEVYDVSAGTFSALPSIPSSAHFLGAANDALGAGSDLSVVYTGGFIGAHSTVPTDTVDTFSSATQQFTVGHLLQARAEHTATTLQSGLILVVGGVDQNGNALTSCELYDPVSNQSRYTGSLNFKREAHTANLLPDGTVIVNAGVDPYLIYTSEIYDPSTETWTSLSTATFSGSFSAANGFDFYTRYILSTGGYDGNYQTDDNWAYVYDRFAGTWSQISNMTTARWAHSMVALTNGQILITGGYGRAGVTKSDAELFSPADLF